MFSFKHYVQMLSLSLSVMQIHTSWDAKSKRAGNTAPRDEEARHAPRGYKAADEGVARDKKFRWLKLAQSEMFANSDTSKRPLREKTKSLINNGDNGMFAFVANRLVNVCVCCCLLVFLLFLLFLFLLIIPLCVVVTATSMLVLLECGRRRYNETAETPIPQLSSTTMKWGSLSLHADDDVKKVCMVSFWYTR
eukprot:GHVU01066892.1.p1 GENE.GHVU01066892.1~~GHVU01066892.1.p1  ORF type:complete len:193 (+),score=27.93 GHVU01066892.1:1631-2209(+)